MLLRQLPWQRKTKIEKLHRMPNNKTENMQISSLPVGEKENEEDGVG